MELLELLIRAAVVAVQVLVMVVLKVAAVQVVLA